MGFLNKAFRKVKKQIQPGNMFARDMGPGNMPRRPSLDFLESRMPRRSGGFGGSLREAIRRMQEQGGMGMPANPDGRVYAGGSPGLYAPGGRFNRGNNPGMNFGDQIGYTRPNKNPSMPIAFNDPSFRMIGTPQPIARRDPSALERLPMGGAPSFNPTIFGQPIPQGADFSNMPDFSQIDMSQLDLSGIPQSISQMNLPQMPEGLPSIEEIQGNRRMPQMRMGEMQPRMMMAAGGLTSAAMAAGRNLPGRIKGLSNKIFGRNIPDRAPDFGAVPIPGRGNLTYPATALNRIRNADNAIIRGGGLIGGGGLGVAGVIDATQGLTEPMAMANLSIDSPEQLGKDLAGMRISIEKLIELASQKAQEIGAPITEYVNRAQRSYEDEMEAERMQQIDSQEGLQNVSLLFNQGGEAMKGYANGGEIEAMLGGMDSGEQEAMGELEQMAPEMEMIDQLVMMVAQMIQQGASEEQVISFLREQGLDDEDIGTVLQLVAEMAETEEVAAQNEIGSDLEQLG
jgi:hypothetical protein